MKLKSEIGEVFNGSFEVALHIRVLKEHELVKDCAHNREFRVLQGTELMVFGL